MQKIIEPLIDSYTSNNHGILEFSLDNNSFSLLRINEFSKNIIENFEKIQKSQWDELVKSEDPIRYIKLFIKNAYKTDKQ